MSPRYTNRFGMPLGLSSSMNGPTGGAGSPFAPAYGGRSPLRQRLPILPDMTSQPNISPAGSGSSSGFSAANQERGEQAAAQQRTQAVAAGEAANERVQQQNAQAMKDQAVSIADYRAKRDAGPQATANREQTQEATALGIDPSSSAADIAAAASGPYRTGADGRIAGGDSGNGTVTQPNDVRNAVLNIQAGKDGAQRAAVDAAYAKGAGSTPFAPLGQKKGWAGPDASQVNPAAPAGTQVAANNPPDPNETPFSAALRQQQQPSAPSAANPQATSTTASTAAPSAPDPNATPFSMALQQQRQLQAPLPPVPAAPGSVAATGSGQPGSPFDPALKRKKTNFSMSDLAGAVA